MTSEWLFQSLKETRETVDRAEKLKKDKEESKSPEKDKEESTSLDRSQKIHTRGAISRR